jgi:transposase
MEPVAPALEFAAYVGIDWADKKHFVCLTTPDGRVKERSTLEHQPEALMEWVNSLQQRFPGQRLAVALEQARGALIYALMPYEFLVLYPINPSALAKYRKVFYLSGAKDDPTDAELLAELVQRHRERLRAWQPDDEATRTLSLLVAYRRHLVDSQTNLTNQLSSLLKLYFPQALKWAGRLATIQACDFLTRWHTLPLVQSASASELRQFYREHGARKGIEQRLAQIPKAQPLTQDGAIINTTVPMIQALIGQLRPLLQAIKQMDQQLAGLFAQHENQAIFSSFPGAGPVLAPRLLAAFGNNRERFASAQGMQQFSGHAPVLERSGQTCHVHRRYACPKFVLQTFHEFAAQSLRQCSWARADYARHRQRGLKHHAALRALAFKWIRIMFRCWQERQPYDDLRYQQVLRSRHSPLVPPCGGASMIPVNP